MDIKHLGTLNKMADAVDTPKKSWMELATLAGMGLISAGIAAGGLYLAVINAGIIGAGVVNAPAVVGGLFMAGVMGFVLDPIVRALNNNPKKPTEKKSARPGV